jgi:hypothetical protein
MYTYDSNTVIVRTANMNYDRRNMTLQACSGLSLQNPDRMSTLSDKSARQIEFCL